MRFVLAILAVYVTAVLGGSGKQEKARCKKLNKSKEQCEAGGCKAKGKKKKIKCKAIVCSKVGKKGGKSACNANARCEWDDQEKRSKKACKNKAVVAPTKPQTAPPTKDPKIVDSGFLGRADGSPSYKTAGPDTAAVYAIGDAMCNKAYEGSVWCSPGPNWKTHVKDTSGWMPFRDGCYKAGYGWYWQCHNNGSPHSGNSNCPKKTPHNYGCNGQKIPCCRASGPTKPPTAPPTKPPTTKPPTKPPTKPVVTSGYIGRADGSPKYTTAGPDPAAVYKIGDDMCNAKYDGSVWCSPGSDWKTIKDTAGWMPFRQGCYKSGYGWYWQCHNNGSPHSGNSNCGKTKPHNYGCNGQKIPCCKAGYVPGGIKTTGFVGRADGSPSYKTPGPDPKAVYKIGDDMCNKAYEGSVWCSPGSNWVSIKDTSGWMPFRNGCWKSGYGWYWQCHNNGSPHSGNSNCPKAQPHNYGCNGQKIPCCK